MKIMVVDDSIVFRTAISQALSEVPGYNVYKTCSNGKIAIDFLKQNPDTDIVTLDMEMPVMDGMETIKGIREFNKDIAIIVFSSSTTRGAEKTIDALSFGANDFVAKIEGAGTIESSLEMIRDELVPKIEAITAKSKPTIATSESKVVRAKNIAASKGSDKSTSVEELVNSMRFKPKLVCIGCSTGGPEALGEIFRNIKDRPSFPMLVVQHMPPIFTKKLAEMLNKVSGVDVREAQDGDQLANGVCYIAPGDYHMEITKDGRINLNQNEKVCYVRPAVDVLYQSISENYHSQVLNIVLTGMGEDGCQGSKYLAKKGAYLFIQDEETSVVWGMPGAISRAGLENTQLPITDFGKLISLASRRI